MVVLQAPSTHSPAVSARSISFDVDLVRSYLRDIGRVPLL
ncbi:MAG: sigma-70 factor domain-containing protein, partial [Prochlorococcus sp.]